jgi:hypothetical protein
MGEFIRLSAATLLGALISFGTTLYFEHRKDQRTERQEGEERERELRQAVRLIANEIDSVWIAVDRARDYGFWWSNPPHDLQRLAWTEYGATLARLSDHDTWWPISEAYSCIAEFNARLGVAREGREVLSPFAHDTLQPIDENLVTEEWLTELSSLDTCLSEAHSLLDRLLRPSPTSEATGSSR